MIRKSVATRRLLKILVRYNIIVTIPQLDLRVTVREGMNVLVRKTVNVFHML